MTVSLVIACLWVVAASVIGLLPQKTHKPGAVYFLIPTALILLPWVFLQNGWFIGLLCLLGAASILRWPLYFLWKFLLRLGKQVVE